VGQKPGEGDGEGRTGCVDRVRACDDHVPRGEGDERLRDVDICARLTRAVGIAAGEVNAGSNGTACARGDPVSLQALLEVDPGHKAGAMNAGVGTDGAKSRADKGSVGGYGAGDCVVTVSSGAAVRRPGAGLYRAGQDVAGADAAGGVGPGVGVNGDGDLVAPCGAAGVPVADA